MTASKIAALTACLWPGCDNSPHRKNLCPKHGHRVGVLESEGVSRDQPETWEPAWSAHSIALRARRAEHGRGVLAGVHATRARSVEAPQPAVQPTAAVERGSAAAIVPPKVGDRWGDLTPEQRAMVPVGSELGGYGDGGYSSKCAVKLERGWVSPAFQTSMEDDGVARDRRITRLGPAPTATPEPDRSSEEAGCASCGVGSPRGECPKSERPCGHHCNHSWTHDACHWCGATFGEEKPPEPETIHTVSADDVLRRLQALEAAQSVTSQPLGRPLHPATSTLLTALADADEGDVLDDVYNLERGCDADLDTAVYAWRDAGCPDAGNDIQFGPEVAPQPPPTNTTGDVWQELIDAEPPGRIRDLMVARREQGIAKYGRPLGRENGRDHTADAIQEALDGMVYATAAGRVTSMYAFRDALVLLTGEIAEGQWVRRSEAQSWVKELEQANAALVRRAEAAEAARAWLTEEVCTQTGATAEEVAECMSIGTVHKPVVNHRMGDALRKRFAAEAEVARLKEAVKGAKVLDILFGEPELSEKSRRVVALNTDALRALVSDEEDAFGIAAKLIADTIDAECGIVREVEGD